jgi:hypothetical protein
MQPDLLSRPPARRKHKRWPGLRRSAERRHTVADASWSRFCECPDFTQPLSNRSRNSGEGVPFVPQAVCFTMPRNFAINRMSSPGCRNKDALARKRSVAEYCRQHFRALSHRCL